MKKKVCTLMAAALLLLLTAALCGCGKEAPDETFEGVLIDAQSQSLVVRGDTEVIQFFTTQGTAYDYGEDDKLCVGDEIAVEYHRDQGRFMADTVKLTTHQEKMLVIGGTITDLTKYTVTVSSENLTVKLYYDENTTIQGVLNKGDIITVTYEGDLSEHPYAVSIVVIQEMNEEALAKAYGTVAEVTKDSMLLSVDSADAYRFVVTEDTMVQGDSKKMKTGDRAEVIYTGNIKQDPVARSITIDRDKKQKLFVIDGAIEDVSATAVRITTGKKHYRFRIGDDTEITHQNHMIPGHLVTITYTGDLEKKPKAVAIYCSKKTEKVEPTKEKKTTKVTKETKETEKPTEKTKSTKATKKPTEPTLEPTEEPTEPTEEPTEPTDEPTEPTEEPTEPTDPTEPSIEPTEEPEDEPTDEPAEEPTEEPEDEPTKKSKEKPSKSEDEDMDMMIINADGTIREWKKRSCVIKVDGGGTLKLDTTDASISSGYLPQEDDQVRVTYDGTDMKMLDLQLVYRSESEDLEDDD